MQLSVCIILVGFLFTGDDGSARSLSLYYHDRHPLQLPLLGSVDLQPAH